MGVYLHGGALWAVLFEWSQRHQQAELLLGEAGLVDPEAKEWEEKARGLEEEGKAASVEHAKAVAMAGYYRAPLEVARRRREEDDESQGDDTL